MSSASDEPALGPLPKVSQTALLGTVWTLCGVATLLVIARLVIRRHYANRFFADDYLTVFGLVILISNNILVTLFSPVIYEILLVSAGRQIPGADFLDKLDYFYKCQFSYTFLFWTGLWTIKSAFLAFFFRLTHQLVWPRRAWIVIAVVVALSYIGCVISYLFACTGDGGVQCKSSDEGTKLTLISLEYSTAVDIITDASIIALPIALTAGLNMSLPQKLGLIAALSLGGIIGVFAIIRAVFNGSGSQTPEISWLTLWTSIESSVAVMAICLASFKVLFDNTRKSTRTPYLDLSDNTQRRNYSFRGTNKGGINRSDVKATENHDLDEVPEPNPGITVVRTYSVSGRKGERHKMKELDLDKSDNGSQEMILG